MVGNGVRIGIIIVFVFCGYLAVKPLKFSYAALSLTSGDQEAVEDVLFGYRLEPEEVVARFALEEAASEGMDIPTVGVDDGAILQTEIEAIFFVKRSGEAKSFKWYEKGHTFLLVVDAPCRWYVVSRLLSHMHKRRLYFLQFLSRSGKSGRPLWLEMEIKMRGHIVSAASDYLVFTNDGTVYYNGDEVRPDEAFVEKMRQRKEQRILGGKLFVRFVVEWDVPVQRVLEYVALMPKAKGVPVLRIYLPDEKNEDYLHFNALREGVWKWKAIFGEEEEPPGEEEESE